MIVLMAAFNAFSHGTQDLYPTFLQQQHHFDTHLTGTLTAIMNVGAIVGGIGFGIWSETIGRKRAIIVACLLAMPVVPIWAFTATPLLLGIGAFLMQVAVQGAWGIVPVHLNELSPPAARAMFPGFAYQLGNLMMSYNAHIQARIAESHGNNYGLALAIFGGAMALVIAGWTALGPERKNADFAADEAGAAAHKPSRATGVVGRGSMMSSYRATADRPEQAKAIVAVILVHVALAAIILTGLKVGVVRQAVEQLTTLDIREPPPPPPAAAAARAQAAAIDKPAGPPAPKAEPTPVVAPPPKLPVPSPIPAAKVAGTGSSSNSGASDAGQRHRRWRDGQWPAAAATPATHRPALISKPRPARISGDRRGPGCQAARRWSRSVIQPSGAVTNCRVVRSSGDPDVDAGLCPLIVRGCCSGRRSTIRAGRSPFQMQYVATWSL